MGIFTLGLFKGVADGYSKYAEAEREAELEAKKAKSKADAEAKKLEREYELKTDLEKFKVSEQLALKKFEAGLDVSKEQRKNEAAIAATFGYVTPEGKAIAPGYEGDKRLPTAQERQEIIRKNVEAGTPMFAPSGYNIQGYAEALKRRGMTGSGYNNYLTLTDTSGMGSKLVPLPVMPFDDGTEGERTRNNIVDLMATVSQGNLLRDIMVEQQNGDPHGNFQRLSDAFRKNGGKAFLDQYMQSENKQTGERIYSDPLALFNVEQNIKDPTVRKWFVDNVVSGVVGFSKDLLYELAGVDTRIPYSREELRNNVILRDKQKYERFLTVDQDGKAKIRDDIYKEAKKLTDSSGVRIQNVMGFVSRSSNPLKAMQDIQKDSEYFNSVLVDTKKPTLEISVDAEDELTKLYEKYGVQSLGDKKQFIRLMMKRDPNNRANRAVRVDSAGNRSLVYTDRQKKYQIDPKQARVEAGAAKDSMEIIDNMLAVASGPQGARPGLTGNVINFSAGIQTIASGLTEIIGNVQMDDATRAEYLANIDEFRKFDFLGVSDNQQQRQRLFQLMGEQLAFALAAVAQGGASGRAISDRDVEAWRTKLGLSGVLMSEAGVQANLNYLRDEMEKSLLINSDYARAQSKNDFLATYILDTTERRNKTIDALVFNGSPYDYTDRANPTKKPTASSGAVKAARMIANPDGTARKVAPKD